MTTFSMYSTNPCIFWIFRYPESATLNSIGKGLNRLCRSCIRITVSWMHFKQQKTNPNIATDLPPSYEEIVTTVCKETGLGLNTTNLHEDEPPSYAEAIADWGKLTFKSHEPCTVPGNA